MTACLVFADVTVEVLAASHALCPLESQACRVLNTALDAANKDFNIFVIAIVDGPAEGSILDSVLKLAKEEFARLQPLSAKDILAKCPSGNGTTPVLIAMFHDVPAHACTGSPSSRGNGARNQIALHCCAVV